MMGLRSVSARDQRGLTLIELLAGMVIMGIITTLLLMSWFTLNKSYGFTIHSADARDSGRQAIQRLQREIRDAEKPPAGYLSGGTSQAPDAIIYRAQPYWIAFSSTFNNPGNSVAADSGGASPTPIPSAPHLVLYRLYTDGELWRFEDDGDGTLDNVAVTGVNTEHNLSEQQDGEGRMLILKNVVNLAVSPHVPVFDYSYYDADGDLVSSNDLTGPARRGIVSVQLRLLVDLDPSRQPVFADLRGTAQLRNAR
jgi:prepilin-type N-terminal cleavage/methylation domain-containing protein